MQKNKSNKFSRRINGRDESGKRGSSDAHDCSSITRADHLVVDVDCPEAMTNISSEDHCTCHSCEFSSSSNFRTSPQFANHVDEDSESFSSSDVNEGIHSCKDMLHSKSCASKVDELQLDLLECALEYEIKMLEMKMKMVKISSENTEYPMPGMAAAQGSQQSGLEQVPTVTQESEKRLTKRLDMCTKRMNQLQVQRDSLANELSNFRMHQKKYEMRKKCMDGLIRHVNDLQKKLQMKEEEVIECQLKEKEAKARLDDLVAAVERSKATSCEPKQLVKLIPSIRSWLRSLRKSEPIRGNHRELLQLEQFEAVLGRILESVPKELLKQETVNLRNQSAVNNHRRRMDHNTPVDCIKEVYALQQELEKLAASR